MEIDGKSPVGSESSWKLMEGLLDAQEVDINQLYIWLEDLLSTFRTTESYVNFEQLPCGREISFIFRPLSVWAKDLL